MATKRISSKRGNFDDTPESHSLELASCRTKAVERWCRRYASGTSLRPLLSMVRSSTGDRASPSRWVPTVTGSDQISILEHTVNLGHLDRRTSARGFSSTRCRRGLIGTIGIDKSFVPRCCDLARQRHASARLHPGFSLLRKGSVFK